jgi:acid phosphatase
MHGQAGCPNSNAIRSGDDWLKDNLPALEAYASGHRGVIFVVWDEGASTDTIPFLAIGPSVKKNYVSKVQFTHTSVVKSVEEIFGLPYLATVKNATDLSDLFESGRFP